MDPAYAHFLQHWIPDRSRIEIIRDAAGLCYLVTFLDGSRIRDYGDRIEISGPKGVSIPESLVKFVADVKHWKAVQLTASSEAVRMEALAMLLQSQVQVYVGEPVQVSPWGDVHNSPQLGDLTSHDLHESYELDASGPGLS